MGSRLKPDARPLGLAIINREPRDEGRWSWQGLAVWAETKTKGAMVVSGAKKLSFAFFEIGPIPACACRVL
jgi:hypothetical protein